MNTELYNKGLKLLNELHGGHSGEALVNAANDICPDFATMVIEWSFGTILSRKGTDIKTRELAIIASCVTLGNAMPQLKAHIEAALNLGVSKEEIVEIILQTALYAGFAAVTNAFAVAKEVFNNRGK